ncbi:MAG: hypothetical protein JWO94_2414, partial [Verrucomicrobiaceae bacterium]|nr:hypothetical protein [Verrucomicrobiaceae bacterium]
LLNGRPTVVVSKTVGVITGTS